MKTSIRLLLFALYATLFLNIAHAHYNPRVGSFISRDPLGEAGGFNLYAYCGNDPVNRHDPLGLAAAPFQPGVTDEDSFGAAISRLSQLGLPFLASGAAQINAWLDAQETEFAETHDAIALADETLAEINAIGREHRSRIGTSMLNFGGAAARFNLFGGKSERALLNDYTALQADWASVNAGRKELETYLGTLSRPS